LARTVLMPEADRSTSDAWTQVKKHRLPGQLGWLWLTIVVLVVDQLAKHAMVAHFQLYERLQVLPVFNLTLAYNSGAAFSFLADAGGWQRWFFTLVALAAAVLILTWLARLRFG